MFFFLLLSSLGQGFNHYRSKGSTWWSWMGILNGHCDEPSEAVIAEFIVPVAASGFRKPVDTHWCRRKSEHGKRWTQVIEVDWSRFIFVLNNSPFDIHGRKPKNPEKTHRDMGKACERPWSCEAAPVAPPRGHPNLTYLKSFTLLIFSSKPGMLDD